MYKSQKSITDQGIPKLPTESVKVSESLSLETQVATLVLGYQVCSNLPEALGPRTFTEHRYSKSPDLCTLINPYGYQ